MNDRTKCLIGLSNHTGGGVVIFERLKEEICHRDDWLIIYPNDYDGARPNEFHIPDWIRSSIAVTWMCLPFLFKKRRVHAILNLMDVPICWSPQAFLFDWPYIPYSEVKINTTVKQSLRISIKRGLFTACHAFITLIGYQHEGVKKRMRRFNNKKSVCIWPNGINVLESAEKTKERLQGQTINILVLSKAYPHKRLWDIEFVQRAFETIEFDFRMKVTIDECENSLAAEIVSHFNADNRIEFIGNQPLQQIPKLYEWCDVVFLPSSLESFSGLLVESAFYRRRILCTDYDFNTEVAGNNAIFYRAGDFKSFNTALLNFTSVDSKESRNDIFPSSKYSNTWRELAKKIVSDCEAML